MLHASGCTSLNVLVRQRCPQLLAKRGRQVQDSVVRCNDVEGPQDAHRLLQRPGARARGRNEVGVR